MIAESSGYDSNRVKCDRKMANEIPRKFGKYRKNCDGDMGEIINASWTDVIDGDAYATK